MLDAYQLFIRIRDTIVAETLTLAHVYVSALIECVFTMYGLISVRYGVISPDSYLIDLL